MNKNCIILTLLVILASTAGLASNSADDDDLYVITNQSTASAIYSLDDIDKITFTAKGINFWNTGWPTEYAYGDFRLIVFNSADVPSGIDQSVVGNSDAMITYNQQQEMVSVRSDKPLSGITVYDLQGRPVAIADHVANVYDLSLSSVPRGIYIVKVNGGAMSQKIVK